MVVDHEQANHETTSSTLSVRLRTGAHMWTSVPSPIVESTVAPPPARLRKTLLPGNHAEPARGWPSSARIGGA